MQQEKRHPLADCLNCPLNDPDSIFVPSEIPERPRLAVVGEAPGKKETIYKKPFTGPSGKLLDRVLSHYDYTRDQVMYTNVCLCRPPDNATPPKAAIAACRPRLIDELSESGVRDIAALGGTASEALVAGGGKITKARVGPPKVPANDLVERSNGRAQRVVATWHPAYCVIADTRILTTDLRWVNAGDIKVDDELVGFDEHLPDKPYARRMFKPTTVTNAERLVLPCYEVTTSKGTITCSSDHMWLTRKKGDRGLGAKWVATKNLTSQHELMHFTDPWETLLDYEAGWVAGILDGEGWLSQPNGLGWGQNDGPVADRMLQAFTKHDFEVGIYKHTTDPNFKRYNVTGPRESLRAVGMFRPARLLGKADQLWQRQCSTKRVPIISANPVGEREVVAITTTERTFVAEGFMSHNCLRTGDAFPAFVGDLAKLQNVNVEPWKEPNWQYYDEVHMATGILQELMRWQDTNQEFRLVVDIEAGIDKDDSFDHPNEFDLLCVGLCYAKGRTIVIGYDPCHDKGVLELLKQLLRRSKIIAHNGKFDLAGLYPHLGPLELWFDTMLASYALSEIPGGHGLKVLGVEKLGTPEWESEIRKFIPKGGNYGDVPRPILYKYNAFDVAVTWDLYELFDELLENYPDEWPYETKPRSLRDVHDFMVAAGNQLMYLELNGIAIDRVYQQELRRTYNERLGGIEDQLNSIVSKGEKDDEGEFVNWINPRSPKQIKEFLAEQGVNVASTNADTLELVVERLQDRTEYGTVVEFCKELLGYRRQQKLSSTYIEGIRKRKYRGRVYTTYMLHGTTSGRLASRNPNLQNIVRDKEIRQQFCVTKPENVFCHGDFKQAEGRVIATLAQDEYLLDIFSNPEVDLFDELSDQLYGKGKWRKEVERIRTKAFFYGLGYGREAYSIAMEYGIPVSEAERRLREFMDLIPATADWQRNVQERVLKGKDLITPFGRRRRFWLITDDNRKDVLKEALSFLPQSTASDICLDALTHLRPRLRGRAFIRLTIHDALVAECHERNREEVSAIMKEEMSAAGRRFTDYVPFPIDITYGRHWGEL